VAESFGAVFGNVGARRLARGCAAWIP